MKRLQYEHLSVVAAILMSSHKFRGDHRDAAKHAKELIEHCDDISEQHNAVVDKQEREALESFQKATTPNEHNS